jgi:hypothetical protein
MQSRGIHHRPIACFVTTGAIGYMKLFVHTVEQEDFAAANIRVSRIADIFASG